MLQSCAAPEDDDDCVLRVAQAAGHRVTAFYLQIWFQDDFRNFWEACPWEEDLDYCRQVSAARCLGPTTHHDSELGVKC
jgi:tRNA U34 2-thiouridine synthase MnmA/TrmU